MCSCSGSCNCNSTTIPRGPIGPTGATGAASTIPGPQGPPGSDGLPGSNGISTFTTLTASFVQPGPNLTREIFVVNNSWMSIDQIIFIGPSASTDSGGFYRVVDTPVPTSVEVMRMDWIIPDVAFEETGQAVGAVGTIVTPSGTIGPEGIVRKILDETSGDAVSQTSGAAINNHSWAILDLENSQDTVSFDFIITSLSGNGNFSSVSVNIGATQVSRFKDDDATLAAEIKYNRDPQDRPPGYVTSFDPLLSEDINFIKGVVKITRRTNFTVEYDITYYMYNSIIQESYPDLSYTKMVQKIFSTVGVTSVPSIDASGLNFSFSVVPNFMSGGDTFGTDIKIYNAIKLSSIL